MFRGRSNAHVWWQTGRSNAHVWWQTSQRLATVLAQLDTEPQTWHAEFLEVILERTPCYGTYWAKFLNVKERQRQGLEAVNELRLVVQAIFQGPVGIWKWPGKLSGTCQPRGRRPRPGLALRIPRAALPPTTAAPP